MLKPTQAYKTLKNNFHNFEYRACSLTGSYVLDNQRNDKIESHFTLKNKL